MISRQMVGWGLVLVFVGWPQALLAELEETPVASVEFERAVHFLTPDEANVVVPPGFYTVEAEENGLQLTHGLLPDEGGDVFLLQAKPGTHAEQLDGPIARSIAVEEDAHYLTLLLPEGQSLEVIGSYSGVRPRGANWWETVRQKAKKGLVAVKDKYEEVTEWNRLCKKRYTKANAINNCCASKYNSCKRVCRKKGKQQASCQQQCETLNEGCWIRQDANPNWMVNYCGSTENQRRAKTRNMSACCQKMEKRCNQSCQSFPMSGRKEFCGRCTKAATLCRNDRQEILDVKGGPIEVNPSPRSNRYALELNGQFVGHLHSFKSQDFAPSKTAPQFGKSPMRTKVPSQPILTIQAGGGMSPALYSWIETSLNSSASRRHGAIIPGGFNSQATPRIDFSSALITEVAFPSWDASSKDAAYLSIKLSPGKVTYQKSKGGKRPPPPHKSRGWLASNYRFMIQGMEKASAYVLRIEPLVMKLLPPAKVSRREPRALSLSAKWAISPLEITVPMPHGQPFVDWANIEMIQGSNAKTKNAQLQILSPDLKTPLLILNFKSLGIMQVSVSPLEAGSEKVSTMKVKMAVESMKINITSTDK